MMFLKIRYSLAITVVFFVSFGRKLKLIINKFGTKIELKSGNQQAMNLSKKEKNEPKFQVYGIMDKKLDEILSTTLRFCPSNGP